LNAMANMVPSHIMPNIIPVPPIITNTPHSSIDNENNTNQMSPIVNPFNPNNNAINNNLTNDDMSTYGRRIPVYFQEPASRTLRSYRDIQIQNDDVNEEIDYGFGDYTENRPKFNL